MAIDKVADVVKERSPSATRFGLQMHSKRISYAQMDSLRAQLVRSHPDASFDDASQLVGKLRLIKSEAELYCIQRAARYCAAGVRAAQRDSRPGMTEAEVSSLVYGAMMRLGCEYPAYPPFVCAGQNACLGHYTGAQQVLREGDTLFVEIGGCHARYVRDLRIEVATWALRCRRCSLPLRCRCSLPLHLAASAHVPCSIPGERSTLQ